MVLVCPNTFIFVLHVLDIFPRVQCFSFPASAPRVLARSYPTRRVYILLSLRSQRTQDKIEDVRTH